MSKKAIAEMTAYEMAGLMVLSNVVAEPLVDKVVIKSVFGGGVLVLLMIIVARLSLINKFSNFLEHKATIIIENGQLNIKALKKISLSFNQFEALLRNKGHDKIAEIQTAIFEPNGELSVFPKPENKPVTLKDLNITVPNNTFTIPIIFDGNILLGNLYHIKQNEIWLKEQLTKQGINDYKEQVALAEVDASWNLVVLRR